MPGLMLAVYAAGFAGGLFGGYALWRSLRGRASRRALLLALVVGLVLGAMTVPLTYAMRYPLITPLGGGHVVGIPFGVAFVDAQGQDHAGWASLPALIGNILFWFLAPQGVLLLARKPRARPAPPDAPPLPAAPRAAQDDRD
jgi:hypothetical protein